MHWARVVAVSEKMDLWQKKAKLLRCFSQFFGEIVTEDRLVLCPAPVPHHWTVSSGSSLSSTALHWTPKIDYTYYTLAREAMHSSGHTQSHPVCLVSTIQDPQCSAYSANALKLASPLLKAGLCSLYEIHSRKGAKISGKVWSYVEEGGVAVSKCIFFLLLKRGNNCQK